MRPARRTWLPTTNWCSATPMRDSTYGDPHDSSCHVAVSPDALVTRTLKAACGLAQETAISSPWISGFHFPRTACGSDGLPLRPARAKRTQPSDGTGVLSLHLPRGSRLM